MHSSRNCLGNQQPKTNSLRRIAASGTPMKANRLGDVRAEYDQGMLEKAFYETADYLTLIEPQNRGKCLVVGRRGTGKSALMAALKRHYKESSRVIVITIAPEDYEIIQLRTLASKLTGKESKYSIARSGFKIFWRYAIAMEIGVGLRTHYKFQALEGVSDLSQKALAWHRSGRDFFQRFAFMVKEAIGSNIEEEAIGLLAQKLPVRELERVISSALEELKMEAVVLIDKLDEGYEPDAPGIAIIAGVSHAVSGLAGMMRHTTLALFLRDNIFRGIAKIDADFSRNLEGQVLRLHWDKYQLLNMICQRLRVAYGIEAESNQKLWDRCTAQDIRGAEGFAKCLQLTLYRPRDLLLLLNEAILRANSRSREHIDNEDIEITARGISTNRLEDLRKEYEEIVAGIQWLTAIFSARPPSYSFSDMTKIVSSACLDLEAPADIKQQYLLTGSEGIVYQLYSIGFIGIEDEVSNKYVFCHDGKTLDVKIADSRKLLIHPCYWIALGISETAISQDAAESIHDEYDVEVSSETPALRNRRIGQMMAELDKIPMEAAGASQFESWCKQVLEVLFVKSLRNVELHPNKGDVQRRDIVGTNFAVAPVWARILQDYSARQVVFEIKNLDRELEAGEFRQMLGYLGGDHGSIGFFVTRAKSPDIGRGVEMDWIKELYFKKKILAVKLTGPWLASLLSKIRNPQKHDAPNHQLSTLLDRYSRNYLNIRS